ncbi:DNA-binding transcriptional LysR family regulator [Rhizobium sp. SG741]|nr:DNA-binding transcriptional LysR family regulator [Rhizobium sp. SG741]
METLANLESFVRTAEHGSFSEAARRMSLTPAAVSRNVAMLERNLGIRLFHRSTRKLVLTEAGESFRLAVSDSLDTIQAAIGGAAVQGEPKGVLKVSLPPTLGVLHILPHLPKFLSLYPGVKPEFHFDARPVDLVADGYDTAIGGGFDLNPGIVARTLAPAHIIAVASPGYMAGDAVRSGRVKSVGQRRHAFAAERSHPPMDDARCGWSSGGCGVVRNPGRQRPCRDA